MLKITGISVPRRSQGRAQCWQPESHLGHDPSTGIPELSSEQSGQGMAQWGTGEGQHKLQEPPGPVQGLSSHLVSFKPHSCCSGSWGSQVGGHMG